MKHPQLVTSVIVLMTMAFVTGCVSLETAAPPVATLPSPSPELDQGRLLYISKCAHCHTVEPVTKYSLARWNEILPDMAERTKLDSAQSLAVRAYVLAVLRTLPASATTH